MSTLRDFPRQILAGLDWSRGVLVRGPVSGPEIIRFVRRMFGEKTLEGCRPVRTDLFELSFKDKMVADRFLKLGSPFDMDGKTVEQRPAGEQTKIVYVHGLPFPIPDSVLGFYLKDFGEIRKITRESWGEYEENTGVRHVHMVLTKNPPNFIRVGDYEARLSYVGLTRVCRKCRKEGHFAENCTSRCYNCQAEGHFASNCPKPCYLCKAEDHTFTECSRKTFAQVLSSYHESQELLRPKSVSPTPVEVSAPAVKSPRKAAALGAASSQMVKTADEPPEAALLGPVPSPKKQNKKTVDSPRSVPLEPVSPHPILCKKADNLPLTAPLGPVPPQSRLFRNADDPDSSDSDMEDSDQLTSVVPASEPPTKKHRCVQQDSSPELLFDSTAVIHYGGQKKFSLDLSTVFPSRILADIFARNTRPHGTKVAGHWREDRRKLFLRPAELEKLEARKQQTAE